jgi:glycosyltransferase involved in cell wall biosynthesis
VPPGDADTLARALEALSNAPQERKALADAAYSRLVADFGMTAGIDKLDGLLRSAMANAR